MNLLGVRTKFVELSGRYDLVNDRTNYVDNGANFYIQEGQALLDDIYPTHKHRMRYMVDKTSGSVVVELRHCKSVHSVWVYNEDGERYELSKRSLSWLKREYNSAIADLDQADPLYYTIVPIALPPDQKALETSDYSSTFTYGYEDIMFADEDNATDDHWKHKGILILPPLNNTHTIEVEGNFQSVLESDTDTSYWSVNRPLLCVMSAMAAMEMPYRNSQGLRDLSNAIDYIVRGIRHSDIEEEITDIDTMEG